MSDIHEVEQTAIERACKAGLPPLRESLTFRPGTEECGIDIPCVPKSRGFEQPARIAVTPGSALPPRGFGERQP